MPSLLASADIAIVPVRNGMLAVPSKLFEAMASGVAIVLAAEGAVVELVESAGAGLAVEPGDVKGLARALEALASSPAQRSRFGAAGRRLVVERYDRKAICSRFVDALEVPD
jgi:glycosyltransferase involved in cell wall biosynthesis